MCKRLIAAIAALQMMSVAAHAGVDCYAEASGGKNITAAEVADTITVQADGFQLGLGGGCDLTVDRMLFGIWGRYDFADVDGSVFNTVLSADDYWSGGGRVGYKINDGTLLYGVFGFARSDLDLATVDAGRDGVLYGAGLEIDLAGLGMPNVSGFVAWEHIDWRDKGAIESDTDVIRTGVRIKLNVLK